jgi:hypothetical protein
MTLSWASAPTQMFDSKSRRCHCKFFPKKNRYHLFRRCLEPPYKTPLPCSSAELDTCSALWTHSDDTQTVLSITASFTPRHIGLLGHFGHFGRNLWLSPIGLLGHFGRKSSETLDFLRENAHWRKNAGIRRLLSQAPCISCP